MQFTINVGTDYSTVKFNATLKPDVFETLIHHFERLGGVMIGPKASDWTFPSFITSEVLSEVIHNTCYECGGLMKDSTAFQNTLVSSDDFGNDAGERGSTQSRVGEARQIKVRKCSSCGHSYT